MSATVNFPTSKFSAPLTASKLDKLAKRGIGGGIDVDIAEIPENVCQALLIAAIEDFLRGGLKNANKETITQAEAQQLMRDRLEILKSGSVTSTRKAGTQDPVKAGARRRLKQMFKDRSDEDIPAKELTAQVTKLFALHKQYGMKKTTAEEKAKLQPIYDLVEQAIADERESIARQAKLNAGLAAVAAAAKAAKVAPAAAPAPKASKAKGKGAAPAA